MPVFKQWVLAKPKDSSNNNQTSNSKPGSTSINNNNSIVSEDNFDLNEDHTPELQKGEILCRALFLSVDPITSLYMKYGMSIGQTFPGRQVARIVESRHKEFLKGKIIYGSMGWQTYSVVNADAKQEMCGHTIDLVEHLPRQIEHTNVPKSACLGVLGVPGLTAYIALVHVCKAKEGENIVISSAAGQIGHLIGQIAKLLKLNVIGYTGDGDKSSWIKTELGFDWAFNYKTQDIRTTLKIATASKFGANVYSQDPGGSSVNGVDIFIDAVGGVFNSIVMEHMRFGGRVCILGTLANYGNPNNVPMVPATDFAISLKELSIFGFNVYKYIDLFDDARDQLSEWIKEGLLKPYEHVVEGFENMPKAFIDQMEGKSQGKVIVRV